MAVGKYHSQEAHSGLGTVVAPMLQIRRLRPRRKIEAAKFWPAITKSSVLFTPAEIINYGLSLGVRGSVPGSVTHSVCDLKQVTSQPWVLVSISVSSFFPSSPAQGPVLRVDRPPWEGPARSLTYSGSCYH